MKKTKIKKKEAVSIYSTHINNIKYVVKAASVQEASEYFAKLKKKING